MKKPIMILSMLTMALLVTFSACKKDDENDEVKTPADYLTAHSWTLTSMEINPGLEMFPGFVVNDLFESITIPGIGSYSFIDDCDKDDLYIFNTDQTVTIDTGTDHCDVGEDQQYDGGSWELSDDGQTIILSDAFDFPTNGSVSTLDDNNFIVVTQISEDFGLGVEDYTITMHFVK